MALILTDLSHPKIAIITLNRPEKRNALSLELIEQLTRAIAQESARPEGRVIVLCGAGPSFCAGLDLAEAADPACAERSAEALCDLYLTLCQSPLVTIAAARGAAVGGGAGLATACDLVVASDHFQLGYPEVHRGLVAALVSCVLRRQVGDHTARGLLLLGRTLSANEALALGLINQIAPDGKEMETAMAVAQEVLRGAPGAISRTKRLLDDLAPRKIADDLKIALRYHVEARNSAESAEGIAAFQAKRPPRWST